MLAGAPGRGLTYSAVLAAATPRAELKGEVVSIVISGFETLSERLDRSRRECRERSSLRSRSRSERKLGLIRSGRSRRRLRQLSNLER